MRTGYILSSIAFAGAAFIIAGSLSACDSPPDRTEPVPHASGVIIDAADYPDDRKPDDRKPDDRRPAGHEWLKVDSISSQVTAADGSIKTIDYSVLIAFEGTKEEQKRRNGEWQSAERLQILRSHADMCMRGYRYEETTQSDFQQRYARALMDKLNAELGVSYKVAKVMVENIKMTAADYPDGRRPDPVPSDQEWLRVENLSSELRASDGAMKTVSYSVLIAFEGTKEEQKRRNAEWQTAERRQLLRTHADSCMRTFSYEDTGRSDFQQRYGAALTEKINNETGDRYKVKTIVIENISATRAEIIPGVANQPRADHEWLEVDDVESKLKTSEGAVKTVEFTVKIAFEGNKDGQKLRNKEWNSSERLQILRTHADNCMRTYSFEELAKSGFEERYEKALMKKLNAEIEGYKVIGVMLEDVDID